MRQAHNVRETKETKLEVGLSLDGSGKSDVQTGIGFFDHMLDLMAFHSGYDLMVKADGDLDVDDHHTVEDIGILMGKLFSQAIGDKRGIQRYGSFRMPMDETLAAVDLDISGRPYLVFLAEFSRDMVGGLSTEMVEEFLRAFAFNAGITLHVEILHGKNDHHKIEAIFKALGRALAQASAITSDRIVSSKGVLE
ncbi:MAG: imidazoleglycerol-phosphate dehydratase HisB [Ileibacterium sp.]|nr:imidazoleglycerol-phosphate dehydratase HisB [Ileibacterium sp.]